MQKFIAGAVDYTHTAFAELGLNSVMPQSLAGHEIAPNLQA